nr:protein FAR1-RELATED SEQUENCE 5-like [Ipomoea batatas]
MFTAGFAQSNGDRRIGEKIAIGEDRRFRRLSQLEKIAIGAWRYGVILGELWCISSCCYGLELSDIMMCIGLNMDSASGGCDEGYSTDIGVEGSACDMEISPGRTTYWRPNCAESLKPHVGQQFVSLDTAFGFYKQYVGSVGFDCRKSTTRKGRDGGVVLKQVVCSREGFKKSSSSTSSTTQSNVVKRLVQVEANSLAESRFSSLWFRIAAQASMILVGSSVFGFSESISDQWITLDSNLNNSWALETDMIAVGAFSTSLATFNSPVAIVLVLLVFTCNPSGNGASSSCGCWCCGGCAGCGTSGTGIDGFPSSGGAGAFSSLKAVSTCPYPNPPDFISSRSLLDSSLNVQFFMAGKLLGTMRLKSTTRRAKWRLNHGSTASPSSIFLFNAFGVIYAVVFSKNHLHSFNISGIAFTVLFVISIFPFGKPRTAATSSAVIWIVCPFWSFNVQLLGSKFSTNHSPIWRGKLVICRSRRLPNPMSFTAWRCAGFSCSTVVVSIFGSALIFSPSSSALVVLSLASVSSGLSTSSAWAGSAVDVRGSLLVDVFPSSIAFRLLPA